MKQSIQNSIATKGKTAALQRGFTLLEVLVAVFSLAIISVGLMVILNSVQTTVQNGRKVSKVTNYASAIQKQLADDIAQITRDGFLLIVNQYASGSQIIPLDPNQPLTDQSARRVDELMFFARGDDYTGFREPVHEELVVRADEARIYYGHGQRQRSTETNYSVPKLYDVNNYPQSLLGANFQGNPNRYAGTWTLLRHETMLIEPAQMLQSQPARAMNALSISAADVLDSKIQIRGRPSAASVFNRLCDVTPDNPLAQTIHGLTHHSNGRPVFSSGLVDTAATSLDTVRAIVATSQALPFQVTDTGSLITSITGSTFGGAELLNQQTWMYEALPSRIVGAQTTSGRTTQVRVRYEDAAPDLMNALSYPSSTVDRSVRRADQLALAASRFIPNCSEFIVEWSFGNVYPDSTQNGVPPSDARLEGRQIWHGLTRADTSQTPLLIACPYADSTTSVGTSGVLGVSNEIDSYHVPYELLDPTGPSLRQRYSDYEVPSTLIHGVNDTDPGANTARNQLISYFGYINPLFNQPNALSASQPWPWPKQLRITIRVADPDQSGVEDTLQFVFDLPQSDAAFR
ncbi:MAG: type II secretion system protein [Phycisphaeraceae bacterium]|nr:type II secretion system protein [Phycisphaerales bacterium]MCB9861548.1 type II secretion system protein [Phycisphaeraceae bacterium]